MRSGLAFLLVLAQSSGPRPDQAPARADPVRSAIERGAALLAERQETLGGADRPCEWPYEGVYRVQGEIPIGYRIGGTSIAAWALLEAPGWDESADRRAAVERALAFVLDALGDPRMSAGFQGRYDVRGWGHAYALTFLLRMREQERVPAAESERVERAIAFLIDALQRTEIAERGGWNDRVFPRSESFGTAMSVLALLAPELPALHPSASGARR